MPDMTAPLKLGADIWNQYTDWPAFKAAHLRAEELGYLFPDANDIGSAAVMPLYRDGELGFLAVGSSDATRYDSEMGTLFLGHIADIIIRLLPRLAPDAG